MHWNGTKGHFELPSLSANSKFPHDRGKLGKWLDHSNPWKIIKFCNINKIPGKMVWNLDLIKNTWKFAWKNWEVKGKSWKKSEKGVSISHFVCLNCSKDTTPCWLRRHKWIPYALKKARALGELFISYWLISLKTDLLGPYLSLFWKTMFKTMAAFPQFKILLQTVENIPGILSVWKMRTMKNNWIWKCYNLFKKWNPCSVPIYGLWN